jgi:hypothetical protein
MSPTETKIPTMQLAVTFSLLVLTFQPLLAQQTFEYRQEGYQVKVPPGWHVLTDEEGLARRSSLTISSTTEWGGTGSIPEGSAQITIEVLADGESPERVMDRRYLDFKSRLGWRELESLKRRTAVVAGRTVEELSKDYLPMWSPGLPPEDLTPEHFALVLKCTSGAVEVDGRVFIVHLTDHNYPGARGAYESVIASLRGLQ